MIYITTIQGPVETQAGPFTDEEAQRFLEELKDRHLSADWNWRAKEIVVAQEKRTQWDNAMAGAHTNSPTHERALNNWRKWSKRLRELEEERADFQRIMGLQELPKLRIEITHTHDTKTTQACGREAPRCRTQAARRKKSAHPETSPGELGRPGAQGHGRQD